MQLDFQNIHNFSQGKLKRFSKFSQFLTKTIMVFIIHLTNFQNKKTKLVFFFLIQNPKQDFSTIFQKKKKFSTMFSQNSRIFNMIFELKHF